MANRRLFGVPVFLIIFISSLYLSEGNDEYINRFAIKIEGGQATANLVARNLGFTVDHELRSIGVFLLSHPEVRDRTKRSAEDHVKRLRSHPKVLHAQHEQIVIREKREIIHDKQVELQFRDITDNSIYLRVKPPNFSLKDSIPRNVVRFKDPCYRDQWYFNNEGQSGGKTGLDLNVMAAWENGFTGTNVVICILDDGIDHEHEDLKNNYDPKASTDLNDLKDYMEDPMPNVTNPLNRHGTRCAGEVAAAADNDVCGVGVAYTAKIGGVRILDGVVTDSLEAEALNFAYDHVDIYSSSWGPRDDGKRMEQPKHFAKQALEDGAKTGRGGKGSIYVWATGNGGMNGDCCSADGYVSSIYSVSVGSITDWGKRPYFMENCPSTMAVVPTGGEMIRGEEKRKNITKLKVVTTDIHGGCVENFQGTSSAAPLAAGCIALALQANPELTWRDVQHIVVHSSRIPSSDSSWILNGAGLHVSHKFGYGLMDCGRMVEMAQEWHRVPEQHVCTYPVRTVKKKIPSRGYASDSISVDGCMTDTAQHIDSLEHVQIQVRINHSRRGDIQIFLISPLGTVSEMLSPRVVDNSTEGINFTFMSVHHWMEDPRGRWRIEVHDYPGHSSRVNSGELWDWSLILYGTAGYQKNRMMFKSHKQISYKPPKWMLTMMMNQEQAWTKHVTMKRVNDPSLKTKKASTSATVIENDAVKDLIKALKDYQIKREYAEHHFDDADILGLKRDMLSDQTRHQNPKHGKSRKLKENPKEKPVDIFARLVSEASVRREQGEQGRVRVRKIVKKKREKQEKSFSRNKNAHFSLKEDKKIRKGLELLLLYLEASSKN